MTDRAWFSCFTTSGEETERVYSYNPGAQTGLWSVVNGRKWLEGTGARSSNDSRAVS